MRAKVTVLVALAAAACSGRSATPAPAPARTSTLARGVVTVGVVHTCGAGGKQCAAAFLHRLGHDLRRHDGLLFATPDTVIMPSHGCGGAMRGPFGNAQVTGSTIRWHVDWVGVGQDCDGTVFGFVRFSRPVYDMRSPVEFVATETSVGRQRRTSRYPAFAAPDLARWVHTGPGWEDFAAPHGSH